MTNREKITPFVWGLAVGAVALTIVAVSTGWVVTAGSSNGRVHAAWVDGQAAICNTLVQAHRKANGDVADLAAYPARATREALAKTFAVVLPGQEAADSGVISSCSNMLMNNPVVAAKQ
jgi:hypothetical protein